MTEQLFLMFDASIPPSKPYPNASVAAGYIGGNTPHIWTLAEWNKANNNGAIRSLPIWVGYLEEDPKSHARDAINAAVALGWKRHMRRYIVLDKETQMDRAWVAAFAAELNHGGFMCLEYRSLFAVVKDPTPINADNWVADWHVKPEMFLVPRTQAFQFTDNIEFDGTTVDLSVITETCFLRCGIEMRHAV